MGTMALEKFSLLAVPPTVTCLTWCVIRTWAGSSLSR